jgi:threonine dehydrogenase-like Zn-dependent dehydrogenase
MNALWLENNAISLREVPLPQTTNTVTNEVLIKIRKAGICSTDLELVRGYYPYTGILGHEFVGEVVAIPASTSMRSAQRDEIMVGDRVVGEINAVCNQCEQCLNGRPTHCENRTVLGIVNRDGVFADYTTLPSRTCTAFPILSRTRWLSSPNPSPPRWKFNNRYR